MRSPSQLPRKVVQQMNQAFFDISNDGILRYLDPAIGALHNDKRQITVRVNLRQITLDLWIDGQVVEVFSLVPDAWDACARAFFAYFSAFENMCRQEQPKHMAA